ncbi:MAG: glycogen debranching enzyme, partial [Aggregatilineales bacterium]
HIDGFRFDLASILGRDRGGHPLANPPLLETLAHDPILAKCKLIAEAWDAAGLYQVGSFPAYGRWAEWNGKFRDDIRDFVRGWGNVADLSLRVQGSPDLYYGRGANVSINFVTCHDGFTLHDVVSYNHKHNEANGENNRDGTNDNNSWNCGVEGETDNPDINALRRRQMKNFMTILFMSQGVPMILMGDEMGRSKYGNNNTYCHDNDLTWLDWSLLEQNGDLYHFMKNLIHFRHDHPVLRGVNHLNNNDSVDSGYPDISWHGEQAWQPDWSEHNQTLAFMLDGLHARGGTARDDMLYIVMNADENAHWMELPVLPRRKKWHLFVNTGMPAQQDIYEPGNEPLLNYQERFLIGGCSCAVLVGRKTAKNQPRI